MNRLRKQLYFAAIATILGFPFLVFGQQQLELQLKYDGHLRTAIVVIPSGSPAENGYPLLLILHGLTQSAKGIMKYSGFNQLAEREKFIAVYPDGLNASWNAGFGFNAVDDVGFLIALIDTIQTLHPVDSGSVFSCGFSNGGFMSYQLACTKSHRFAAVASVAGSMANSQLLICNPEYPVSVLQIHGTEDYIVPFKGRNGFVGSDRLIEFWGNANGCSTEFISQAWPDESSKVLKVSSGACMEQKRVELLKIVGGGHTWPGSTKFSGMGETNKDINASEEIWKFFMVRSR